MASASAESSAVTSERVLEGEDIADQDAQKLLAAEAGEGQGVGRGGRIDLRVETGAKLVGGADAVKVAVGEELLRKLRCVQNFLRQEIALRKNGDQVLERGCRMCNASKCIGLALF